MGCSYSALELCKREQNVFDNQDQNVFRLLDLSANEIQPFYDLFERFRCYIEMEDGISTFFSKICHVRAESIILKHFVEGIRSHLNFHEFLILIWSFCILSETQLASFTFDAFDKDKSNTLSLDEIKELVKFTFGGPNINRKVKFVVNEMKFNSAGEVSRDDFICCLDNCYAFLFHTLDMQRKLKEAVFDLKIWNNLEHSAHEHLRNPEVQALIASVTSSSIYFSDFDSSKSDTLNEYELQMQHKTALKRSTTSLSTIASCSEEESDTSN
mmetsp:Transcript_11443/g.11471  ORF Transcript_11443/g.11471 Transcript_11443/m.11471 type:complete len:270 (+) Transcript_11443:68-877(+)|eukprot:CAMPEP_0182419670 /NCGR_PEP_ID=MMETSP1167-20130531/4073_1 /TAXON_ID=2988 /ORGANISM="Mallomonas Sp, Strain CCMP3275" /LENGTH=269 /DNA_ID=CAMNT_0024594719 /DNA_START=63 /DNA_END=872 /DNA_ORIENTATION=+